MRPFASGSLGHSRLWAEAVSPAGLDRRQFVASACAGCAAMVLGPASFAAADIMAAPTRPIHAQLDAAAACAGCAAMVLGPASFAAAGIVAAPARPIHAQL